MNTEDITKPITATGRGIAEGASQAWVSTKEKAGEVVQSGERLVRDNPGTTVLSVCGLGFLLGLTVGWIVSKAATEERCWCADKFLRRWGHKLNLD